MKTRMKKVAVTLAVVMAGTAVAVAAVLNGPDGRDVPHYERFTVAHSTLTERIPASGELVPEEVISVRVGSNVPTRAVRRILVGVGERVSEGDILVEIDDRGLELDLESAEARYESERFALERMTGDPDAGTLADARVAMLDARSGYEEARRSLERELRLQAQGISSSRDVARAEVARDIAAGRYESARHAFEVVEAGAASQDIRSQEAAVGRARGERDAARLALEEAVVRSPADATVAQILVNRGDLATQEQELISLVRTDSMILRGGVDESDIGRVSVGQEVMVHPFGFDDGDFPGEVIALSQRAESQGSATVFFVDILVANPETRLRWGMSADAEITARELNDVLVVPREALQRGGRSSTVLLADGEERRDVTTGIAAGDMVEIVSGLEAGEEILVPVPAGGAAPSRGRFSGPGGIF